MTRVLKNTLLVSSHVAAFLLTAVWAAGYLAQGQFRTAATDPLYRLGVGLEGLESARLLATARFESDLAAAGPRLSPPGPDVYRLIRYLRMSDIGHAAEACRRLAWPDCGTKALGEMRKSLRP
jgi:hypothetical protein